MNDPTKAGRFRQGGIALIAVAGIGFLTVADELRHIGEFLAVLGIFASGVSLLLAGMYPRWSAAVALQWTPVGIAIGEIAGAAIDRVVLGVSLGAVAGLLLAYLLRTRYVQAGAARSEGSQTRG